MGLSTGTRLGPYEILGALGAGGMGEVYRARDTRLDRSVAVKVLNAALTSNTELRARFEREARTISQLNHPHICTLHDVGQYDGTDFLVMELLEGQTLAERLKRGALPLRELLPVAAAIADALDAAHSAGIVHRDLKPGNIMLTAGGVKLLDFGLAKPLALATAIGAGGAAPPSFTAAPTMSHPASPLTERGTVLGTIQYMSPEQIEGRPADARSDLFAFGAVLYEMATGRRAFEGKSQLSVASAILEKDPPPLSELQPASPARLDEVIRTCLAKDPQQRYKCAHDVRLQLQRVTVDAPASAVVVNARPVFAWTMAAVAIALAIATGWFGMSERNELRARSAPIYSSIPTPENSLTGVASMASYSMAISPDGRLLVYNGDSSSSNNASGQMLYIRPLNSPSARPLLGTEAAQSAFWSPDSRYVAFFTNGKLSKIDVTGGPPQTIVADDKLSHRGSGSWAPDGTILFTSDVNRPLFRVAASGGEIRDATRLGPNETAHYHPHFLPDGRHFLYLSFANGLYVASLDQPTGKRLLAVNSHAVYVAPGYLLFMRGTTLLAQRFNLRRLEVEGEAVPVAEDVVRRGSIGGFSASENGILAYRKGGLAAGNQRITFLDRSGKELGASTAPPGIYVGPRFSPDGQRLAVGQTSSPLSGNSSSDIWLEDMRGARTRFTFGSGTSVSPVWSPDGSHVAYGLNQPNVARDLYVKAASGVGGEELLFSDDGVKTPSDWSRDGRYLLFSRGRSGPQLSFGIWVLPLTATGPDGRVKAADKPFPLVTDPNFQNSRPRFAPNGQWVAYDSNESGPYQVYVTSFPDKRGKWQVSTGGGDTPLWSPDGRQLYFLAGLPSNGDTKLMVVDVTFTQGVPHFSNPKPAFDVPRGPNNLIDISPDGKRFVMIKAGPNRIRCRHAAPHARHQLARAAEEVAGRIQAVRITTSSS